MASLWFQVKHRVVVLAIGLIGIVVTVLLVSMGASGHATANSPLLLTATIPTDVDELVRRAEADLAEGDVADSMFWYGHANRTDPTDTMVAFEYVRVLIYYYYADTHVTYYLEEALEIAGNTLAIAPDDAHAQAAYARVMIESDQTEAALVPAVTAVELAPDWAEAHAILAMAYYTDGRFNAALDSAETAVELDPNSIDAHRAMALALAFTGDYEAAIEQYLTAISINPNLDLLYFELAPFYIIQEDYEAAHALYDRVLEHNPRNVKAWTRKCETYFRERDDAAALDACAHALEIDNSYADVYQLMGTIQYTQRHYEESVQSFAECVRLMDEQAWADDERHVECYMLQGLAESYLDHCEVAITLFEAALSLNSEEYVASSIDSGIAICVAAHGDEILEGTIFEESQ